jgi:hypothetical protein
MSAASASLTAQDILESIKSLSTADLLKVATAATTLAAKNVKKASKSVSVPRKKGKKTASTKSDVSQSSSDASPVTSKRGAQLVKPRAWVTYVLEDARANGWPAFPAKVTTKDKLTGLKTESVQEMPASEERDGAHVFPDGKAFQHKHAMSLSKVYWTVKSQTGDRKDLYDAFEEQYVPAPAAAAESAPVTEAEEDN